MKKLLFLWLVLFLFSSICVNAEMRKFDDTLYAEDEEGNVRALDLGEPTEEEKAQMEREAQARDVESRGFQGGIEDTDQEMAGDDSDSNWIFD